MFSMILMSHCCRRLPTFASIVWLYCEDWHVHLLLLIINIWLVMCLLLPLRLYVTANPFTHFVIGGCVKLNKACPLTLPLSLRASTGQILSASAHCCSPINVCWLEVNSNYLEESDAVFSETEYLFGQTFQSWASGHPPKWTLKHSSYYVVDKH